MGVEVMDPQEDRSPARALVLAAAASGASPAYNCYKIIATDLGLEKPWEEKGKEEPDSLVHQMNLIKKRVKAGE